MMAALAVGDTLAYCADQGTGLTSLTPHVRISWSGSSRRGRCVTAAIIEDILSPFGPLVSIPGSADGVLICVTSTGTAYATFASPESAVAAAGASPIMPPSLRGLKMHIVTCCAVMVDATIAGMLATPSLWRGPLPPPATVAGDLPSIPGLVLVLNFVSTDEEDALLAFSDAAMWQDAGIGRRVQHYGAAFDYATRSAYASGSAAPNIPHEGPLASLVARLSAIAVCGDDGESTFGDLDLPKALHSEAELQHVVAMARQKHDFVAARSSSTLSPDQVTINAYECGQGIAAHVDSHASFEDGIAILSLGSDIVMDFAPAVRSTGQSDAVDTVSVDVRRTVASLLLPRRSLLLLRGEARFAWTHAIVARRTDNVAGRLQQRSRRVSITLRRVRPNTAPSNTCGGMSSCACAWPAVCATRVGAGGEPPLLISAALRARHVGVTVSCIQTERSPSSINVSNVSTDAVERSVLPGDVYDESCTNFVGDGDKAMRNPELTPTLESQHVHALYDAIAGHFSSTRHSSWPRVDAFIENLPLGALVLDVGCGNGKYLPAFKRAGVAALGVEHSLPLARICDERGFAVVVADGVAPLPVRPGNFDAVMSIAVLHHISTHTRRVAAVRQLLMAARSGGGLVLLQAWAFEQGTNSRRTFATPDTLVPWCVPRAAIASSDAEVAVAGGVIDPKRGVVVFQRFVHAFRENELVELVTEAAAGISSCGQLTDVEDKASSIYIVDTWWDRDNWCVIACRS